MPTKHMCYSLNIYYFRIIRYFNHTYFYYLHKS